MKKDWKDRPRRGGDRPEGRGFGGRGFEKRGERRESRGYEPRGFQPRREEGASFERPQRPSRFQRWGQPRQERDERPRNPKHIFTGREGDERRGSGPRAEGGFRSRRDERRPSGPGRFESRETRGDRGGYASRKPRFGGHGHAAPPAEGQARGRWRNRANREQPRDN